MSALLHALMRRLPSDWASALGSFVVRKSVPYTRPGIMPNAKANLKRHKPDASEAELDALVQSFLDGVGRVMGEYAVMDRFIAEGRFEVSGLEAFREIAGQEPIIAFGLHTGNWETFGPLFQHAGIPLTSFYAPPEDPFERQVAESSRATFGVELLSPDASGAREGLRRLRDKRVVMIFPDEARNGQLMAPLFGRAPHTKGNLAIAARLARHAGARFVICHSERSAPCRFHLSISAPFALPDVQGKPDVLADVAFLNSQIEPIIARNIPRWYFLDDAITAVGDGA
jgi:Kdo2-lipid IVA lauroyltransferase/acyltransferase